MEAMHLVISDLLALRGEWQKRWNNPLFRRAYADLEPGLQFTAANQPQPDLRQVLRWSSIFRPLPGMDPDALRGDINERLQNHRRRAPGGYQLQSRCFRACRRWTPRPRPRLSPPASSSPVTGAGSVAFATEGPYLNQIGLQTLILGPGDIEQAHQPE